MQIYKDFVKFTLQVSTLKKSVKYKLQLLLELADFLGG